MVDDRRSCLSSFVFRERADLLSSVMTAFSLFTDDGNASLIMNRGCICFSTRLSSDSRFFLDEGTMCSLIMISNVCIYRVARNVSCGKWLILVVKRLLMKLICSDIRVISKYNIKLFCIKSRCVVMQGLIKLSFNNRRNL